MFNIIETARLLLRPWQANDLEELEQLWASPAVRQGRHLPPERIRAIAAIDRSSLEDLRDYALLSLAVTTGRQSRELASLVWGDVRLTGKKMLLT